RRDLWRLDRLARPGFRHAPDDGQAEARRVPANPARARRTAPYDLKQAASYLVPPKVDIVKWISKLRPTDLPAHLQTEFWDARLKRQKWEFAAGHLWRTEAVQDVLGETFRTIKETMQ